MDNTNLNDSQTTIDVSELPGHKDMCAIRKTVSLASTIDVGRINEKRPATNSPIRKHEGKHALTDIMLFYFHSLLSLLGKEKHERRFAVDSTRCYIVVFRYR